MKIITLIVTILVLLLPISKSYSQTQTTTIKGNGKSIDTIITRKKELNFNKAYPDNFNPKNEDIQALRPYFVKDMVKPNDLSHPQYIASIKEAKARLPEAKTLLSKWLESNLFKERLAKMQIYTENDLNTITFTYLPIYYVTPNIVSYKNGANIINYYNLGTGGFKYLALRNNKLIGFLDFYPNNIDTKIVFYAVRQQELQSYNQVIQLGKLPIGLSQTIGSGSNSAGGGGFDKFGYVEQGHLVLSYYEEYKLINAGADGYVPPNPRIRKEYVIETVESFCTRNDGRSLINSWVENAVTYINYIKRYPPKNR
ncbi:hypothetical protein [Pedobacter sp. MW01-1-1]|uniref:hypothetical protein n=1 Tax=Pedobacter sp. MW01-1-1 TaxID=3383027 RepID=UPI003FF0F6D1